MSVLTRSVHAVQRREAVGRRERSLARYCSLVAASAVVAAAAAVVPAGPALASTTYQVRQQDPSCSNSGPGNGTTPFCTISAAAKVAVAGDTVDVHPGTYREQVTAPSGVTFVASSTSAEVVGADSLAGASWSAAGGNAWSTVLSDPTVSQVFRGSTRLRQAPSAVGTVTDSWFFDTATRTLYIDLGGPAPTAGDALEATVRQYGFLVRNDHAVTVQGFTMRRQGGAGILLDTSNDSAVRDVTVSESASYGISDTGGSSDTITGAHVSANGSIGIRLLGTTSSSVTSSFAHSNGFHGISVQGGAGVHVTGNTATGNLTPGIRRAAGIDVSSASLNALVERNISHDNDDSGLEIYTGSTGAVVRRNISYDNGDHGIDISASANATVVSNTSVSNSAAGLNVEGGSTGTTLRNNISVDDAVGTDRSKGDIRVDSASVAGTSIDHDLTFQTNGATPLFEWDGVVYPSLAGLRAATNQEAHGLAADPQFVDSDARDLQLGPASPALDAADSSTQGWAAADQTGAAPVDQPDVGDTGVGAVTYADLGALERTQVPVRPAGPTARLHLAHRAVRVGRPLRADASASTGTATSVIEGYRFKCGNQHATTWRKAPTKVCTFHQPGRVRVKVWVRSDLGLVDSATRWVRVRR